MEYPDEYNPVFHVEQDFWCQKDVFSQGFLGSASRIYIEFGGTYTPAVASDIGKTVKDDGVYSGVLVGYWNSETDYLHLPTSVDPSDPTAPTWWLVGYYPIASGSTITIPSGTGGGVTNAGWQTQTGGGAVMIGHGLNSSDDPPQIILSSSELGFDRLYINNVLGNVADIAVKDIYLGGDVKLYREAEDTLATDDNLEVHNQYLNLDKSTAPVQFTLQVNNVDKSRWLFDGTDVWLTAESNDLKLIAGTGKSVIVVDDLDVTGNMDAGGYVESSYLKSVIATGTIPVQVTSTTLCTNLNADMLDGHHWNEIPSGGMTEHGNEYHNPDFSQVGHAHVASDVTSGTFDQARIPWTSIPASGIQIGSGDIYWQTATTPDVLETNVPWIFDSTVQIGAGLSVTGSIGLTGNITLGSTITFTDINLYRQTSPSVCLELDDDMIIDGSLQVGAGCSVTGVLGVSAELDLPYLTSDPSSPANGALWVRSNL